MIFRVFFKGDFLPFEGNFYPRNRVALKVRLFYAIRRVKGSRKMTRQFKKQVQNQSQSGRSMIEMLGVLAIIAILSIGGIVGYKLAMNYYQADQIANEINLMRNDLKVKYALGNEELLLGDPYDDTPENENYSGHLSTQYDRYPVDYDCIRKDKAEFYNCREADAYYIKVGNVSKGVCKPLTTLVSAMDGLMYMEINKKVYKEDDLCDEANEIYIQFDAEDVNGNYDSNRPEGWCGKDGDCEEPQVCDKENNTCVECTENTHCASNICRKDHTCGECTKDSDCSNPRPICDTESATCMRCAVDDECQKANVNKPVCDMGTGACCDDSLMTWNGSECVCPEDYAKSETSSGKAVCLPYCEQEVGIILLIDHSGSIAGMINDSDLDKVQKYHKAVEQVETAIAQLNIPQEVYSAVYLSGCWYNKNHYTCNKVCNGLSSDSNEGYKINEHLKYGLHSPAQIAAAMKIDRVKDDILSEKCSTVGYAIKDKIIPLCKTGEEKFIVVIYWDNFDEIVDPQLEALVQKCPQTKIYNVAIDGKSYTGSGAAGNFNLNNINDLNNDINNALNEAIQQEACVQRPGG